MWDFLLSGGYSHSLNKPVAPTLRGHIKIVRGQRPITVDTAMRVLSLFWHQYSRLDDLQVRYDLEVAALTHFA